VKLNLNLHNLSAKRLHNKLLKMYPDNIELREQIKAGIHKDRDAERAAKIKRTQQLKAWSALVYQAYKAVNAPKARIRKAQDVYGSPMGYGSPYEAQFDTSPSKRVLDTYKAYGALLQKVADKLRSYRDAGTHTPKQLAREKDIPNDGEHWSDWVPAHIKAQFIRSFELLDEEDPFPVFPRKFYAPPTVQRYKPRPRKPKATPEGQPEAKEHSLTPIEKLRDALLAADMVAIKESTPENIARRDALKLEKEEAIREQRRKYAREYNAKAREALRAWREKQKQRLEGEVK
jgi:hypothetical protein